MNSQPSGRLWTTVYCGLAIAVISNMDIHVGGYPGTPTTMRRLPVIDLVHRGIVLSLVSLSAYGLYIGYTSHRVRMERRRG